MIERGDGAARAALSTGAWESWPGAVHHQTYALAEASAAVYVDAAMAEAQRLTASHDVGWFGTAGERHSARAAMEEALAAFIVG